MPWRRTLHACIFFFDSSIANGVPGTRSAHTGYCSPLPLRCYASISRRKRENRESAGGVELTGRGSTGHSFYGDVELLLRGKARKPESLGGGPSKRPRPPL